MKVELSIHDDKELRAHIKAVIKGEITSIARSEITDIIADVVDKKHAPNVRALFEDVVQKEVRNAVGGTSGLRNQIREMVRDYVAKEVQVTLKNK
ncbi:hypothetical protein D0S45_17535 [Marinifilum sp. JC120]|nr:hypothetical protein D0S45_17535 [Marinifilum sp. JC120]